MEYQVYIADSVKKDVQNIKKSVNELAFLPQGYKRTHFYYKGYNIYVKPTDTYLIFYIIDEKKMVVNVLRVLHKQMNWKSIIRSWINQNIPPN